jgi:cob(I)alamin adenosyltransferase
MPGYTHVYTGNGKGKTTAAVGLALRAVGAGWRVFLGQFIKDQSSSELAALRQFDKQVTIQHFGKGQFITGKPADDDVTAAQVGLRECKAALVCEDYQLVVLDEANLTTALGLLAVEDLLDLIDAKPDGVELVLTGRWAHPLILDRADLVTEMLECKHYHQQGVAAREGIEG